MRIVFTAGGTGGHIYPALAIAEEIGMRDRTADIRFIGGSRPIERDILSRAGYPFETLSVIGLPRRIGPRMALFTGKLGAATLKALNLLRKNRPACLVATGGYVSGAPVLAARLLGIPVYLQEQNSFPGIATRTLVQFAEVVFLGFVEAGRYFNEKVVTVVTGNPVRCGIADSDRGTGAAAFGLDPAARTVLVLGGSQGSRAINEAVAGTLDLLVGAGCQVIWQAGAEDHARFATLERPGTVAVRAYIDDMAGAYAASDLVVGRAGAMTLAELAVCGLPAVLIPLPGAAENHQKHNARALAETGAAALVLQRDLTPELLGETVRGLMENDGDRRAMAEASRARGNRDAACFIADYLIKRHGGK